MYRSFFEMERMPFVRDVPIQELYESPAMSEALGRLAYAADRQLFAVITADAGCGKSTLLRRFSGSLSKDEYLFLYLSDSKLTPRWFYKSMLDQLGIESKFYRGDAKRQLQKEVEIIRGCTEKESCLHPGRSTSPGKGNDRGVPFSPELQIRFHESHGAHTGRTDRTVGQAPAAAVCGSKAAY